jgi:hypothetical protein
MTLQLCKTAGRKAEQKIEKQLFHRAKP